MRRLLLAIVLLAMTSTTLVAGIEPLAPTATVKPRWRSGPIRIAISQSMLQDAPNIKFGSDVLTAIRRSLDAWRSVANIEIVETSSDKLSVSASGLAGDGVNLLTIAQTPDNVLLFKNDAGNAAKTRVFVNRRGLISESDIVLNPFQQFSTDGTYGTFDIETTIKHEIGHLLGLHHSPVVGSIMYRVTPRNGVFGEISISHGIISEDDLAAMRELYGDATGEDCCGTLAGRITGVNQNTKSLDIWLRDLATGMTVASSSAGKDGSFRLGGVPAGDYAAFVREASRSGRYSVTQLGPVSIAAGEVTNIIRRMARQQIDLSVELLGKNGILSDSPITLALGANLSLYVGGRNISSDKLRIETASSGIVVEQTSVSAVSYGAGFSGLRFSVAVASETPAGNYDVCVVTENGESDCVIGGLTVVAE